MTRHNLSQSSGILSERWGVCWYKKIYDWCTMDDEWYNLLYKVNYPRSQQLSPNEFKEIRKYKCREDFFRVSTPLFSHEELNGSRIITYKDALQRLIGDEQ